LDILSKPSATRRELLGSLALGAIGAPLIARSKAGLRALAFDAFVLFDPRLVVDRAKTIFGDRSSDLVSTASARIFAYSWFYTSAGRYAGFETLARDAFGYAADVHRLDARPADLDALVAAYSSLSLWPDVGESIERLRRRNIRLSLLSNLPESALVSNLRSGGIDRHFELVLSTDRVRKFKPAPEAYALGVKALRLSPDQIGFAASAGWDASGATWFGYPTVWVNRTGAAAEHAHATPRIVSSSMEGVLRLAAAS
jgi:2-haloacid dehalogenase